MFIAVRVCLTFHGQYWQSNRQREPEQTSNAYSNSSRVRRSFSRADRVYLITRKQTSQILRRRRKGWKRKERRKSTCLHETVTHQISNHSSANRKIVVSFIYRESRGTINLSLFFVAFIVVYSPVSNSGFIDMWNMLSARNVFAQRNDTCLSLSIILSHNRDSPTHAETFSVRMNIISTVETATLV